MVRFYVAYYCTSTPLKLTWTHGLFTGSVQCATLLSLWSTLAPNHYICSNHAYMIILLATVLYNITIILSFCRPTIWPIISFVPTKAYQKSDFPKFSLLPDPEDGRQKFERGKFMRFLSDNKRVNYFLHKE